MLVDLSGGTEYPRFYKITNPTVIEAYRAVIANIKEMREAFEGVAEQFNAEPLFTISGGRVSFHDFELKNPNERSDLEAWCKPDRHGARRIRKNLSKKWNEPAQNTHTRYQELVAPLEEKFKDGVRKNNFLGVLGVSHDMMTFGGYKALTGNLEEGVFLLAIHFDIDCEGVEKITSDEFEAAEAAQ